MNSFEIMASLGISKQIPSHGFYVYAILENSVPCYIGKGKGKRVLQHFTLTGKSLVSYKIRANRPSFDWCILERFDIEADAYLFEIEKIKEYKLQGVKLYNTIHYSATRYSLRLLMSCLAMNEKHESLFYQSKNIGNAGNMASMLLNLMKDIAKACRAEDLPIYRGKSIYELNYKVIPSINGYEQYQLY